MTQSTPSLLPDTELALPRAGEVIAGKYRVEGVVGTGGMGVVLSAKHVQLGQSVAIKVLVVPHEEQRRKEAEERFFREGQAVGSLESDHVVRVFDVGTLESGAPFLVMELLKGEDLSALLGRRGPLPVDQAAECVAQAASAIAAAHARGIVHRDLKPSNLFLTERSDGAPLLKVLDFGISKSLHGDSAELAGNLTATRSVLGSPYYMSPEQVRDPKKVDVRTDIWSLGVILHELLSGAPAFQGETMPGVCAAIAADPPAALRLKRPEVPPELEALVLRCLEKDPSRRFQTAESLVAALDPFRSSPRASASGSKRSTLSGGSPSGRGVPSSAREDSARTLLSEPESSEQLHLRPMDMAASATLAEPRPRAARSLGWPALIGVVLALFVAALLGGRALRRSGAQAQVEPAAPARFVLSIESAPPGAEVFEGAARVGVTPLRLTLDRGAVSRSPRVLVLRKPGYLPYPIVQGASPSDVRVLPVLVPDPVLAEPAASPAQAGRPAEPEPAAQSAAGAPSASPSPPEPAHPAPRRVPHAASPPPTSKAARPPELEIRLQR